jgi:hypothetical protein
MAKKKVTKFDVTKAVKANARERVGQPKPEKVIENTTREHRREGKQKLMLERLLDDDNAML